METEIAGYIKKMFSTPRPEWTPELEGLLIYDTDADIWVAADNIGWIEFKELEV